MIRNRFRQVMTRSIARSATELALVGFAIRNGWLLANHDDDVRNDAFL